jgi:hypothetical protein
MTTPTTESSVEHTEHIEHTIGQRRRRESDSQEQRLPLPPPPPPPRMRELPAYYGKDIQEAQDFISGAERRFRLDRGYYYADDTSKIDYCVLAFEAKPYRQWCVFEEDAGGPGHTTWEQFKAHLFESICDKENRLLGAAEAYERAYQGASQTTDDFAAELQALEKELGYVGPANDKMRADKLYAKLRRELRMEISRRGNLPPTRQGVLKLARHIETVERLFGPEQREVKGEGSGRAANSCRHCGKAHLSSDCPQAVCYKCRGKGHYASKCPI